MSTVRNASTFEHSPLVGQENIALYPKSSPNMPAWCLYTLQANSSFVDYKNWDRTKWCIQRTTKPSICNQVLIVRNISRSCLPQIASNILTTSFTNLHNVPRKHCKNIQHVIVYNKIRGRRQRRQPLNNSSARPQTKINIGRLTTV